MVSTRLLAALAGFAALLSTLVLSIPVASAQDEVAREDAADVQAVLAAIAVDSVATDEPVTVVLAGATSRHTLEIVGAVAVAIGAHGQPAGWVVTHGPEGFDAAGSVITVSDGPGPTAEIVAERTGQRSTVALVGGAGELVSMANELAGQTVPASTDVAIPNTWMPDTLAGALGLISELASSGGDSMRLVTDLGVDHTRALVIVGAGGTDRVTEIAGNGAKPTILAYADESAEALTVPRPTPRPAPSGDGLPMVPMVVVAAVLAAAGFLFARRRSAMRLIPAPA